MTNDILSANLTPEESVRLDYLMDRSGDFILALGEWQESGYVGPCPKAPPGYDPIAEDEETDALLRKGGLIRDDDTPPPVAQQAVTTAGGKRAYQLRRSEAYAGMVYAALRSRNVEPPRHQPIRTQAEAAGILFECRFTAEQVAMVFGITKRHANVLKGQWKKARGAASRM